MTTQIKKDNKVLPPRMNPPGAGERGQGNHLYAGAVPVWYSQSGEVNPECFLRAENNAT